MVSGTDAEMGVDELALGTDGYARLHAGRDEPVQARCMPPRTSV